MNTKVFLVCALSFSTIAFAQKTSNRNLNSPFENTNYISGAFASIIDKTEDIFQIVKDSQSEKYALLYEENDTMTAQYNNDSTYRVTDPSKKISRSIIFNNKQELLNFYKEIENSIKNNIEKKEVIIGEKAIIIHYTKLPLIPGSLSIIQSLEDNKSSASFGINKKRWKDLFEEVK